jgi:hypothetical protein
VLSDVYCTLLHDNDTRPTSGVSWCNPAGDTLLLTWPTTSSLLRVSSGTSASTQHSTAGLPAPTKAAIACCCWLGPSITACTATGISSNTCAGCILCRASSKAAPAATPPGNRGEDPAALLPAAAAGVEGVGMPLLPPAATAGLLLVLLALMAYCDPTTPQAVEACPSAAVSVRGRRNRPWPSGGSTPSAVASVGKWGGGGVGGGGPEGKEAQQIRQMGVKQESHLQPQLVMCGGMCFQQHQARHPS